MADVEGDTPELDVLEFTDEEDLTQSESLKLEEAKRQQALLTDELNQSGVIGLVVNLLPNEWQWGAVNPLYHTGRLDPASKIFAYRDLGPGRKVKIRVLELIQVTFDPSKVLTVSGQNDTYSGPLPQDESGLESIKTALGQAYSSPNREETYLGLVQHLRHNPRPIPHVLPESSS